VDAAVRDGRRSRSTALDAALRGIRPDEIVLARDLSKFIAKLVAIASDVAATMSASSPPRRRALSEPTIRWVSEATSYFRESRPRRGKRSHLAVTRWWSGPRVFVKRGAMGVTLR